MWELRSFAPVPEVIRAFIGFGSNVAPENNIRQALRQLAKFARIVSISTFYRVPALGRPDEPDFYNGVVAIDTDLSAKKLKWDVLRGIEAALGRRRTADKYASRTIDLDLLLYGDCVITSDELTLPDPDIAQRAFIALPLSELAPDMVLPSFRLTVRQVADRFASEMLQPLREYTRQVQEEFL